MWKAATVAAVGLLVTTAACSSADDQAAPDTIIARTTAALAATSAPPTTATPTTMSAPTSASAPPTSEIDAARKAALRAILEAHRAAGEFVGGYIAVRDRDGTITESTAGTPTLDPASGPVDTDVAWNVGSVTKTFVGVVVLQLAEEGLIDLDTGIEPFFPDLSDADRITPRQLLQHTSGLGEYDDQPAVLNDAQREWTPAELIAVAETAGRVGAPGGPYHYSNANYIMLGEIIEQVTGQPWPDEVRTRIVDPLGLTHTGEIGDEQAPGYTLVDGSFVEATTSKHPSLGGAAGSMQSTADDLLLFVTALTDGTLLSPASLAAMETFVPGDDLSQFGVTHSYGLGLEQYTTGDITIRGHLGTGAAHAAFVGYDPDHGTAVAVGINTANAGPQGIMAIEALTTMSKTGETTGDDT